MSRIRRNIAIEAPPGRQRHDALIEEARSVDEAEDWWVLDCHFEHGGPWAGIRKLFETLVPAVEKHRPDLVRDHDYELVHVLPELRKSLEVRNPTLTDTAAAEEKTRNYPADRAFRIVHGLIDFLDAWRQEARSGRWVLACDHVEHLSHIGRYFMRELWRRRGEAWDLVLILGTAPGAAAAVGTELGLGELEIVARHELAADAAPAADPEAARRVLRSLEEAFGDDQVEIQIYLPELIRLSREAGDERRAFRWRYAGLEIYNTLGFYDDALAYGAGLAAEAERLQPGNVDLHWSIFVKEFMSLAGLGRPQEAYELAMPWYRRIESIEPQGQLCYLLAMLHGRFLDERDYGLAEELLDRGIEFLENADLPPHELHFQVVFNRNGLAMLRTFQKRLDEALALCRDGLARLEAHLEPDAHRLHRSVLYYNMAQVYAHTGALPEALESFTAAMEMDPNYSEYYNERGNILLKAGRLEEALADYHRALELSPPYYELYANLGQCYRLLGRFEEALWAYGRSLDLVPAQEVALLGRAQTLEQLGSTQGALEDYDAVVAFSPDQWQARAARAVLLYELGEREASRDDLDRAIEQAPEVADLYQNRAVVLADLGSTDQAIADLTTYLQLSPDAVDREEVTAQIEVLRGQTAGVLQ